LDFHANALTPGNVPGRYFASPGPIPGEIVNVGNY
jgi:hypothetical protein